MGSIYACSTDEIEENEAHVHVIANISGKNDVEMRCQKDTQYTQ